jgi:hypothetical protein
MSDTTRCKKCGNRIWWEESVARTCWVSHESGSWCTAESSHEPESDEALHFPRPPDASVVIAELLVVAYIDEDGNNAYMTHARGDMPASTFLGLTVLAQNDIQEWGRNGSI